MACIAALINTDGAPADEDSLRALIDVAPYRRPADVRIWIDGSVGLGWVPLRPCTVGETVSQPRSLDGRLWAVMDGRLDDRGALVAALTHAGAQFDLLSVSDVDLVLHAYAAWGADAVSRLMGDFALCLWDSRERQLVCARDHFGVKPFYYAQVGNTLVVSSVLQGVRRHPGVTSRLRDEAIGDFLLFGLCLEQAQTPFADVSRLPPAHRLTYSSAHRALRVDRNWSLQAGDLVRYADPREYVERFSSLMQAAVADRLRADRVGVLMSGGLDSSSVAATAAESRGSVSARESLRAFTVVYDNASQDEERRHSSVVAQSLGIGVTHVPADGYEPFERWHGDGLPPEPTLEALTAIMTDVLDLASTHADVVLTGDGGDPLLMPSTVMAHIGHVPPSTLAGDLVRAWRARITPPWGVRSMVRRWVSRTDDVPGWLADELLDNFDPRARWREVWARRRASTGPRDRAVNEMMDPWWPSTFESLDPGATQRPVELRYPFFDVRLVSFALTLPSFPWCLNKQILREAMRGRLPASILARPKTPLAADPAGPRGRWTPQRAICLLEATPDVTRYIDIAKFRLATARHDSLLTDESPGTWAAISLAHWLRGAARPPSGAEAGL